MPVCNWFTEEHLVAIGSMIWQASEVEVHGHCGAIADAGISLLRANLHNAIQGTWGEFKN